MWRAGLDPKFEAPLEGNFTPAKTSALVVVGLAFVVLLTKGVVCLEAANHIMTLNLVVNYFQVISTSPQLACSFASLRARVCGCVRA